MDYSTTQTQTLPRTKKLILSALMAALTCVGTMIIKVPTPTMGYIHPGDGFVLLSGLLLGPLWGALAAGLGSALSDLIGGYFTSAVAQQIKQNLQLGLARQLYMLIYDGRRHGKNTVPLSEIHLIRHHTILVSALDKYYTILFSFIASGNY